MMPLPGSPARISALLFIFLSPLLFGFATLWLGQDASWDTRNYHIYNAWAFATGRYAEGIDMMPSQGQFFFNPLLDVPFYLLSTLMPPKAAYFILGCVQGINIPLLFMIGWLTLNIAGDMRKVAACAALALLGVFSGMGISEIGTQFNDNLTSIGILLTVLLVLRNIDFLMTENCCRVLERGTLFGLPAGLALGLKITCLPFCLGICVAALILTPDWRKCLRLAVCVGFGITLGFLLAYGHWAYYLWQHFGSPMFPFFNAVFRSPLLPPNLLLDYPTPRDGRLFVFPFYFAFNPLLVNEIIWRDLRVPILYALLLVVPVWYFAKGRVTAADWLAQRIPARFLLLVAGVAYYGGLFSQTIYRYLLPLDMIAPLLVVAAVGLLPVARKARVIAASALLLLVTLSIQPGDWGRHTHFHENYAAKKIPPQEAIYILAGQSAYAHLLPRIFPGSASFIRIESRGFPATNDTGLREVIAARLRSSKPKILFVPSQDLAEAQRALSQFGLVADSFCVIWRDPIATLELDRSSHGYTQQYSQCPVKMKNINANP
ncbi:MAG: hypothetical protein PSY14_09665 [bacterium]|nr:hypothetical protein [bacterium]